MCLCQRVSTELVSSPRGNTSEISRVASLSQWEDITGVYWAESRNAGHPAMFAEHKNNLYSVWHSVRFCQIFVSENLSYLTEPKICFTNSISSLTVYLIFYECNYQINWGTTYFPGNSAKSLSPFEKMVSQMISVTQTQHSAFTAVMFTVTVHIGVNIWLPPSKPRLSTCSICITLNFSSGSKFGYYIDF